MSTNGTKPKIEMECLKCKQRFSTPMPKLEISNNFSTSVISAAHPNEVRCINSKCRQPYVLMLGFNPAGMPIWRAQPVEEDFITQMTGSAIIKPNLTIAH